MIITKKFPLFLLFTVTTFTSCQKKDERGGGSPAVESQPTEEPPPAPSAGTIVTNTPPVGTINPKPPGEPDDTPAPSPILLTQMNSQIPVRPAMVIGTLAISGLTEVKTELSEFKEERFIWNPAQIPLEELNKIVCVLSQTGFHTYPNQGKYIAKIILEDCFKSQRESVNPDNANAVKKPTDVVVESNKLDNGDIDLKIWFTKTENGNQQSSATQMNAVTWEHFDVLEKNFYVRATINSIPNEDNPFGIFDMRWEMTVAIDGILQKELNSEEIRKFQQGYVSTKKDPNNFEKVTLDYNQKNWIYEAIECSDSNAWGTYSGIVFSHTGQGTAGNDVQLVFDGEKTLWDVASTAGGVSFTVNENAILPAGVATFTDLDEARRSVSIEGYDFILPASGDAGVSTLVDQTVESFLTTHEATIVGGCDTPANCTFSLAQSYNTRYEGIDPFVNHFGAYFTINNTDQITESSVALEFDGVKTISEVIADFEEKYNNAYIVTFENWNANDIVLPSHTLTLSGGLDLSPSKIVVDLVAGGQAEIFGNYSDVEKLEGKEIVFDGETTIQLAIDSFGTKNNIYLSTNSSNASSDTPVAGRYKFTGGVATPKDIYRQERGYAATAEMSLYSGKPEKGKAITSENWGMIKYSDNCVTTNHGYNPAPIRYGLAFDKFDRSAGERNTDIEFPGRSALKQLNNYVPGGYTETYNPSQIRCEQIGGELANVWKWALFDKDGNRLHYKTDYAIYLENSENSWGDGWASSWGMQIYSSFNDGDRVYIKLGDGTQKYLTAHKLKGVMYDGNWSDISSSQDSGQLVLTCRERCPNGNITQSILDNQWDSTNTNLLYDREYLFDFETKALYLDEIPSGLDSGDPVVSFASGAEGYFSFQLALKSDNSKTYSYNMDSWTTPVILKDGSNYFKVPKKIQFDTDQVYTEEMAYPGSSSFNSAHEGKGLSELVSMAGNLVYEYDSLCCFNWETKLGLTDEWGNDIQAPVISLKKGAELIVGGEDPDGDGPVSLGDKIRVAPEFTELRPLQKDDCSNDLRDTVEDIESKMQLPGPLNDATKRIVSKEIGARPDGSLPILIRNGKRSE